MKRRLLAATFSFLLVAGVLPSTRAGEIAPVLRGHVSGDGKPLAGVLVSDGCRVVRTDGDGAFRLPVGDDSGRFVFVTLPRGYWSDEFYVPLAAAMGRGGADFELTGTKQFDRFDFEQRFGPTYYSFDWGAVHCVVLDGNMPVPGESGWQAVHGAVEGSELEWLKADLAAQPEGKPIVVGVHIPIVSSYPERRSTSPQNAPYWEMTNSRLLAKLLSQHGVRLVLQGHMHENERTTAGGVEYVTSISISGSWWKAGPGLERGVDNCPRGYRIVSVDGNKIAHRYQTSAESRVERVGEFPGLSGSLSASKETVFVFNCFDAPNEATVAARIDNGPWQSMPRLAARSPVTAGLTMPHHFRLVTDTTTLDFGHHSITVRVTRPDGETTEASTPFVVVRGKTGR